MYARETTVINKTGIHARPASEFTRACSAFESEITIKNLKTDKGGNAKSIIMVMSLALGQGTPIEIRAEGPDEKEAVDTLIALVDGGFGE